MKKHSKILAVVMALALLCSIAVVPVSAGELDTKTYIKYRFTDLAGETITSAEKGQVIDLVASVNTNVYCLNFQGMFKYDSDALTMVKNGYTSGDVQAPTANNCAKWLGDFNKKEEVELTEEDGELYEIESSEIGNNVYLTYGNGKKLQTPHNDNMYPASWTDAEKAKYKISTFIFNSNATEAQLLVNTKGEDVDMVRFRFVVNESTTLTTAFVGYDEDLANKNFISYDISNMPFGVLATGGLRYSDLTVVDTLLGIGGEPTVPTAVLTNDQEPKVQWKADADNVLRLRFEGKLTGITPTVGSDEKVTNIAKIGFKYSREDATLANGTLVETKTLYDFTASEAGTYKFCAIVEVPMTADIISGATASDIHATAFITIGDNTSFASDPISTTIANEYTEGLTAGLTPFAA